MEITLEKIELVKDRTGATYKEAKEALEKANGNVVDAIIEIEQNIDQTADTKAYKDKLISKMKEAVKKGNIARIQVKKDDDVLLNIPLNVGVIGTVVAPWGVIAGIVAAFGFKCRIEFIKDDGSVVNITEKAEDLYVDAKVKGSDLYEDIKDKAPDVYGDLKEKSGEAFIKAKDAAKDVKEKLKKKGEEVADEVEDDLEDFLDMDASDLFDDVCEEEVCEEENDEKTSEEE